MEHAAAGRSVPGLHWEDSKTLDGGKRLKAFWYSFVGMGLYEVFPAYIFPALNAISIPCLATKHLAKTKAVASTLTNIFGGAQSNEGMGLLSISLDWQYITSLNLSLPLLQQVNSWIGLVICNVAMAAIYYRQRLERAILSLHVDGHLCQQRRAVQPDRGVCRRHPRQEQGESGRVSSHRGNVCWGMMMRNAAIGALVMHVVLFWGRFVLTSLKQSRDRTQPDRHFKAMQSMYGEAPHWWYLILLAISLVLGLIVVLTQETTMTWYTFLVALVVGIVVAPFSECSTRCSATQ